uniref:Uncharacterized protein LOC111134632 isoform X4 n=1 Tax=Crassostrea virginica TaxID=6565 RepID=A0A8B8EHH7_CRAVI|nr:uncharacterized protein LOC111134632 isoform X4 [Crassostrea virginica]
MVKCATFPSNSIYTCECSSTSSYTLTIPTENMTEFEKGSVWRCTYIGDGRFQSLSATLHIAAYQYNLTGSAEYAVLGRAFTWTCGMFIPTDQTINENMTESEQGSVWMCQYFGDGNIRSPDVTLTIASHQYNLTGSSEYAVLHEVFMWTCVIFIPPGRTMSAVAFYRNSVLCAVVGNLNNKCVTDISNNRYMYGCSSAISYTLTIPAENMTKYEQGSVWKCVYFGDSRFKSLDVTLITAVDVHNVSLVPSDNPLTLREGTQTEVRCVVNSNAVPAPTITWYLGSKEITGTTSNNTSSIIITGNRQDNKRTLKCSATNNNKPPKNVDTTLNVEYPPSVIHLTQKDIIEAQNLFIICGANPGNPNLTIFVWTKVDSGFRQNGSTLQLPNIQRTSSGTYRCTAENTYRNGAKGTNSQTMVVNVLYKPVIQEKTSTIVNETERAELIREVDSNPLSDISWYDGAELLKTQTSVKIANLTIENALCTDTKNFTLSVSNTVQRNVTSLVELIVNCKPKAHDDEITVAITSYTRRISMSTTVIAYPEPRYNLEYKNGTANNMMTVNLYKNAINNFTIYCEQQLVEEMDSVTYTLKLSNVLGASTVFINIRKQVKPSSPIITEAICEETSARIKWESSFDGGAVQSFFVAAFGDTYKSSRSDIITDKGENQTHQAVVPFLQPSVLYTFYVFAKNSIGDTISEKVNCTTLKETQKTINTRNQTLKVAGSVTGVLVVLTLVIVLSCLMHRHFTLICNIGFERRNKQEKTADLVEEKSHYTVMSEHGEENRRNPYDVLTPTESTNLYEAIQMKENQKTDADTYESLNKPEKIAFCDNSIKDSNKSGILKKTDATPFSNTEEYTNTSFES